MAGVLVHLGLLGWEGTGGGEREEVIRMSSTLVGHNKQGALIVNNVVLLTSLKSLSSLRNWSWISTHISLHCMVKGRQTQRASQLLIRSSHAY